MENLKVNAGSDGIKMLNFESERASECIDFALANNIKRLSLLSNYFHPNLDLLLPLKDFIEGLVLNDKVDSSELYQFKKLTSLGGVDKNKIVNLEWFPDLETLACSNIERIKGFETCKKLKSLDISYYNPKNQDLTALPMLESLESLRIIKTGVVTLHGIEKFQNLNRFMIYSASKLEFIASLLALASRLEEIQIELCKKIKDYEILAKLKSLKKIRLSDSGEIKNLSFVKTLPSLEFISFVGTNILDGNLHWCKGVGYVGFDNKRHYSHKFKDFKK